MKNVGLEQRRSSNRLASGYRVNSAADDAAGLAISETMRAQIRGLDQASRNAQDGQAMLLTTEGGLEEIGNMLQRARELLVQSSNDTNTNEQRVMIEQEIGQLGREILSMQNRVEFNSNRVLAMGPPMESDVVEGAADMVQSAANNAVWARELQDLRNAIARAMDLLGEMDPTVAWDDMGGAQKAAVQILIVWEDFTDEDDITGGISDLDEERPDHLEFDEPDGDDSVGQILGQLATWLENEVQDALDTIRANADLVRDEFTTQYGAVRNFALDASSGNNVAWFQVGANSSQGINFDFETVSRVTSAAGWIVRMAAVAMSAPGAGSGIGYGVDVTTTINKINSSLEDVNRVRANLGAVQNRMDYTMRSLDVSSENLSDSESRVRNADMAREMMRFTMANVLQQSSVSMLAQANQLPNNLLTLLR